MHSILPLIITLLAVYVFRLARDGMKISPHFNRDREKMINHIGAAIGVAVHWLRSA